MNPFTIGSTGLPVSFDNEEDGVDNTGVNNASLYTQPEDVAIDCDGLSRISDRFTVAASFGNVQGVYKPGNVRLTPRFSTTPGNTSLRNSPPANGR